MSYSININDMQCVKPCLTMSSGCNFFWMNHITSPTAGVKISERSVDAIVKHHFSDGPPKHLPFVLFAFIPFKKFNIETEKVMGVVPGVAMRTIMGCHQSLRQRHPG